MAVGKFPLGIIGGGTLAALGAIGGLTGDVSVNFATMANGVPGVASGGQAILRDLVGDAGTVQTSVVNGALVCTTASGAGSSAAYTGILALEDIKEFYADVSFADAHDFVALIATSFPSLASVSSSALHIVFGAGAWTLQYVSNASGSPVVSTVQSGTFASIPFGQRCRIGFRLVGNNFYLKIADGTEFGPITSAAAASRTNHCLLFEHFRDTTGIPGAKIFAVAVNLFTNPVAAGRTNMLVNQNNIGAGSWILNAIDNPPLRGIVDAAGGTLGEQSMEIAVTDFHWTYQNILGKAAAPVRCSLRFRVKPIGRDWVKLVCYDGGLAQSAQRFLQLSTGALGTQSGAFTDQFYMVYPLPNGYYQVQADFLTNSVAGLYAALGLATGDTADTYLGDGAKGMVVYDEWLFSRPT